MQQAWCFSKGILIATMRSLSSRIGRERPNKAIMDQQAFPTTILRRRQVEARSGYSRSTIYLRISEGLWTRPISLGARAVGWPAADVDALLVARIAGRSDAAIRALVTKLEQARVRADVPVELNVTPEA